jgi:hypothetical protein
VYASVPTVGAVMLAKVVTVLNKMVFAILMPAVFTARKLAVYVSALSVGQALSAKHARAEMLLAIRAMRQ